MKQNYHAPHAQLPAWLSAKLEADRLNTHASTQQTAREEPQQPVAHYDLYNRKDHISLVESTFEERGQQLFSKSSNSITYQQKGRSRSRRNRIFDSSYIPHFNQPRRQSCLLENGGTVSNSYSEKKQSLVFSPMAQPARKLVSQQMPSLSRFIDTIPIVPAQTIVRLNSSNTLLPISNSNNNPRVTFTYQHNFTRTHTPLQHTAKYNYCSNPQLQQNACNAHINPAPAKISKHSLRKPPFIYQIQQEQNQPRNFITSKISLSNIRQSVVGGYSLATEKLAPEDCISNIELNSSRRHFNEQEAVLGQKISFKNIDIVNDSEDRSEQAGTHPHNIFSDFEHSCKQEFEKVEARRKERCDTSAVLQKSALHVQSPSSPLAAYFPLLLVAMAGLLLLLQLSAA